MSYYPGCDDNDDSNETPEQLALDAAYTKRAKAEAELEALALEQRATGRNIVQGVYYADHDRADIERGRITERCMSDMDRLDATIARLTLADEDFSEDAGGYDPDAVIDDEWRNGPCRSFIALDDAPVFCAACGYQNCDHAREADEMRQEIA